MSLKPLQAYFTPYLNIAPPRRASGQVSRPRYVVSNARDPATEGTGSRWRRLADVLSSSWLTLRAMAIRGGGIANHAMRFRIAANNRRGTATSANWNVTYFECRITFAPIFTSFSRSVVSDQCLTARGKANRRSKFARLYAKANKRNNG